MKQFTMGIALAMGLCGSSLALDKKVLFVGVDGMQFEHIARLSTPGFDRLNITKAWAGGVDGRFSEQNTSSGPGWSTLLTGVWRNKHGIYNNDVGPADSDWPSLFRRVYQAYPDANMYSFSTWGPINSRFFPADMELLRAHSEGGSDESNALKAMEVLQSGDPDFIFVHLDEPDGAGHSKGWGSEYDKSITDSDDRIGRMLDLVEAREAQGEDWLVIVSTDHGRVASSGKGHGGQSDSEKTIFIASNQNLNSSYKNVVSAANNDFNGLYHYPAQTFIVPTILDFMQIAPPAELDGVSLLSETRIERWYSAIGGSECGLEWDADANQPLNLQSSEHLAKFDCQGSADPLMVSGNKVYAHIYGSSCGLQWHASSGTPWSIGGHEHMAKFDCSDFGDPLSFVSSFVYSTISNTFCGLEWHSRSGTPSTVGDKEHMAKFDCQGNADVLIKK